MICFRYIIVNTLHKDNNKDNNNNNNNNNVIKKEAEKLLEDKDRTIQRMWNVKTRMVTVMVETTGTISKSFRKYLSNILAKHDMKALQKTS